MTLPTLYVWALLALTVSIAFVPLILVTAIPLSAVYYHAKIRIPFVWAVLLYCLFDVKISWRRSNPDHSELCC